MNKSQVLIRPIRADERADWEPLWKGYQAFYEVALSNEITATTWTRLHDPAEPMFVLGAYLDGKLVGIVHSLYHRSCWTIGNYCYLHQWLPAKPLNYRGFRASSFAFVHARFGSCVGRVWDEPGMVRRPIAFAVSRCKSWLVWA
jgi:hypothetical protein